MRPSRLLLVPLLAGLAAPLTAQDASSLGHVDSNVSIPMRDGVILRADIWRPDGPGPFPVLVYRTPYGKARVFETYSLFRHSVERGYTVIAQDVRGRYASDGEFLPYQQEGRDGYDTIEWAAAQPWSDGRVGTIGLSYPGAVQWLAAIERPPHLKAMVPAMTFASPTHFWYSGGVWDMSWVAWIWNNIAPDRRVRLDLPGPRTGREAREAWPSEGQRLRDILPLRSMNALRGIADWYYDWMSHPPGDPWWDWAELNGKQGRTNAAVLNLSAWYDEAYGPSGATQNFAGLVRARGGTDRTALLVGPWTHGIGPMAQTTHGERNMGSAAVIDYDETVLRWMDRWVRDIPNGVDREPPVRVYVMADGDGVWKTGQTWPLPGTEYRSLFLHGGAARGGTLTPEPPTAKHAVSTLRSDPAHPVRDPHAERAGAHDYRGLVEREALLGFETEPLQEDLTVVGPIEIDVYLSVDAPDTDLWVRLFDVAPDGTAWNLMSPGLDVIRASYRNGGPEREALEPGRMYRLTLPNLLTANRFKAGHRVRVVVLPSFLPHMSVNLNTGESEVESAAGKVALITLHHDAEHPSRLILPIVR